MNGQLPVYQCDPISNEERQKKLEWMARQFKLIRDQEEDKISITKVKIRCGCNRLVVWMHMYRCLYCGIWFCVDCAEIHFGKSRPEPFKQFIDQEA